MDISEINNVSGPYESRNTERIRKNEGTSSSAKNSKDNLNISENAQTAYKDQKLVNQVKDLPEIRTDVVESAKSKVSSGEIVSDEVIEQTAEKLLKGIF